MAVYQNDYQRLVLTNALLLTNLTKLPQSRVFVNFGRAALNGPNPSSYPDLYFGIYILHSLFP